MAPAPHTFDDPRFGRIVVAPGGVLLDRNPSVVEGERIGRFEGRLLWDRWTTPRGEAEVLSNLAVLRRRQFDTRLRLGDTVFHLRQRTWFSATVERDGSVVAHLRAKRDRLLRKRAHAGYVVERWEDAAEPFDAGMTHLLAVNGPVGAEGAGANLIPWPLLIPVYLLRRRWETAP